MADNKKLSELTRTTGLSSSDEFIVVDKSATNGVDASSTGRTSKIRFDDLKNEIGSQGQKGQKGQSGDEGEKGPRGPEGNSTTGDKGPRGDDGEKGQKGQRGDFQKGDKGQKGDFQKGDKGQKGDFQKGQKGPAGTPSTVKGPKGPKGDFQKGQKGQTGIHGKNNPHIGWRGSKAIYDSTNISFKKYGTGATSGWNDGYLYSDVYYTSGCSLTFKPNATNVSFMFGISSVTNRNNSNRYYNIDAGFYLKSNGTYDLRKAGPLVRTGGSYTKDTTFTVNYDGKRIRYYVNGKLMFTAMPVGNAADVTYFAYASIYHVNAWCVRNWSFEPMAMSGFDGQKGVKGQKGPVGSPSTIKGPKGPQGSASTIKGPKGDPGSPSTSLSNPKSSLSIYNNTNKSAGEIKVAYKASNGGAPAGAKYGIFTLNHTRGGATAYRDQGLQIWCASAANWGNMNMVYRNWEQNTQTFGRGGGNPGTSLKPVDFTTQFICPIVNGHCYIKVIPTGYRNMGRSGAAPDYRQWQLFGMGWI